MQKHQKWIEILVNYFQRMLCLRLGWLWWNLIIMKNLNDSFFSYFHIVHILSTFSSHILHTALTLPCGRFEYWLDIATYSICCFFYIGQICILYSVFLMFDGLFVPRAKTTNNTKLKSCQQVVIRESFKRKFFLHETRHQDQSVELELEESIDVENE